MQQTQSPIYFISGIDTDIGKTFAVGLMAKFLLEKGINTITQKPVESGTTGISSDIKKHRELSGQELNSFDKEGITCSYLFKFPASPHLAADLENTIINIDKINKHTSILSKEFDTILIEGAGRLYVPIHKDLLTIDFVKQSNYPLILVTSDKLGSINHTLMSLELCKIKGINLAGVVFNSTQNRNKVLAEDSYSIFKNYISSNFPKAGFIEIPFIENEPPFIDFSCIFENAI